MGNRQREVKAAALIPTCGLGPDLTAQAIDNLAADRQPQPRTAGCASQRSFLLIEPIKDGFQAIGFDAPPGIRNRHL